MSVMSNIQNRHSGFSATKGTDDHRELKQDDSTVETKPTIQDDPADRNRFFSHPADDSLPKLSRELSYESQLKEQERLKEKARKK